MLSHQATLTDLVDAAATDPLTGLSNRRVLEFSLLSAEANPSQGWALLYCDLDRFKAINDDCGHDAGDAVLRTVASRLLQVVRSADVVARLGGDEFVVLAHADPTQAARLAARVCEVLEPPIVDDHGTFEVGVSVGLATADTRDGVRALLRDADAAMRRVKVLHRAER
jgi:diguanylate cyclase (GGDEF)-like protein